MSDIKKDIVKLLEDNGLNVTQQDTVILLNMATESYQNKNDEHEMPLLITTTKGDHVIMVIVPFAYILNDDMNIAVLHEYFMYQNVQNSLVKFGFDPNDGEIQARVDLIATNPLDYNHFKMAFKALHQVMESIHEDVASLMAVRPTFDKEERQKTEQILDNVLNEENSNKDAHDEHSDDGDLWL